MSFSKLKNISVIEVLVIGGILLTLVVIVLIAINPIKKFSQQNDEQRLQDINLLADAILKYAQDHKGALPNGISKTDTKISKDGVDLCAVLVPTYLPTLPVDPLFGDPVADVDCIAAYDTAYVIKIIDEFNRFTIYAPEVELANGIETSR